MAIKAVNCWMIYKVWNNRYIAMVMLNAHSIVSILLFLGVLPFFHNGRFLFVVGFLCVALPRSGNIFIFFHIFIFRFHASWRNPKHLVWILRSDNETVCSNNSRTVVDCHFLSCWSKSKVKSDDHGRINIQPDHIWIWSSSVVVYCAPVSCLLCTLRI